MGLDTWFPNALLLTKSRYLVSASNWILKVGHQLRFIRKLKCPSGWFALNRIYQIEIDMQSSKVMWSKVRGVTYLPGFQASGGKRLEFDLPRQNRWFVCTLCFCISHQFVWMWWFWFFILNTLRSILYFRTNSKRVRSKYAMSVSINAALGIIYSLFCYFFGNLVLILHLRYHYLIICVRFHCLFIIWNWIWRHDTMSAYLSGFIYWNFFLLKIFIH